MQTPNDISAVFLLSTIQPLVVGVGCAAPYQPFNPVPPPLVPTIFSFQYAIRIQAGSLNDYFSHVIPAVLTSCLSRYRRSVAYTAYFSKGVFKNCMQADRDAAPTQHWNVAGGGGGGAPIRQFFSPVIKSKQQQKIPGAKGGWGVQTPITPSPCVRACRRWYS